MLSVMSGIVAVAAGGATLWYFLPTEGRVHPIAKLPLLDSLIPIAIISALAIGVSLIVNGFV